jgi:ornithine cyclodeaminase/alanine dehydrogenase-like protein (mu-crystallin family)
MVWLIGEDEVNQVLRIEDVIRVSEEAYLEVDQGKAANRPRTFTTAPAASGDFMANTMEGILTGKGVYCLRISAGTRPTIPGFSRSGDDHSSYRYLYDLKSGRLIAIVYGSAIGNSRVQAINAVAAKYMARPDASRMALIGSGYQARRAIDAMRAVRPIRQVAVYSKTPEHKTRFVAEMQRIYEGIEVRAAGTAREAMKGAELVVAATNSRVPVCQGTWLEPGMHLTGVLPGEFDLECYERAGYIVIYNRLHARDYGLSRGPEELPLQAPPHAPLLKDAPEITDIVSGKIPGRLNNDQITLFANGGHGWGLDGGPGYGIQEAAVAKLIYDLARERGLGREIDL